MDSSVRSARNLILKKAVDPTRIRACRVVVAGVALSHSLMQRLAIHHMACVTYAEASTYSVRDDTRD